MNRTAIATFVAVSSTVTMMTATHAQTYPAKAVRMIVTAPAASAPDIIARLVAERLDAALGQRVVVENRPGAGGIVAMNAVRESPADGYTLAFIQAAVATVTPFTFKAATYDIERDFETIGLVAYSPMLFVANNQANSKTIGELVNEARAKPDGITVGNPTRTSIPHLASELLAQRAKVKFQQVPFSTTSQALQALMNGDIPYYVDGAPPLMPLVRAGKIRVLAVASDRVLPGFEGIPLVRDAVSEVVANGWFMVAAPKGTPVAVVQRLNAEINRAIQTPEMTTRLRDFGTYPMPRTVDESRAFVKSETVLFGRVIQEAGIKAE